MLRAVEGMRRLAVVAACYFAFGSWTLSTFDARELSAQEAQEAVEIFQVEQPVVVDQVQVVEVEDEAAVAAPPPRAAAIEVAPEAPVALVVDAFQVVGDAEVVIQAGQDFVAGDFVAGELVEVFAAEAPVAVPAQQLLPAAAAVPVPAKEDLLIARGSEWKYLDSGSEAPRKWRKADFDDAAWKSGKAPLGYGDGHIVTEVGFGGNAGNKHLVTFFRTTFEIKDLDRWKHLVGSVMCDDGVAVFINGRHVFRDNLPKGQLTPKTTAQEAKGGNDETELHDFVVPSIILKEGSNTIAVRVHQANPGSSDLGFDFQLRRVEPAELAKIREQLKIAAQQARVADAQKQAQAEADAAAVQAAAQQRLIVQQAAAQQIRRSFVHISDGQVTYITQNGERETRRNDCVTQVQAYVPGANFIRVMEGDTLAKIAAQRGVSAAMLARLNRTSPTKVYNQPSVLATRWKHEVQPGETLQQLASSYNTQTQVLIELNPELFNDRKEVQQGDTINVPGEYTYHFRETGNSYLRLARYNNNVRRATPFKNGSQRTRRQKAKQDQSLAEFAKEHKVDAEFLAQMNGLDQDGKVDKDQWLLIEYSCEVNDNATAQQLVQYFGVELDLFLAVNDLDEADGLEAGQRVQIPIGDRMNRNTSRSVQPASADEVVSVVLGESLAEENAVQP